MNGLWWNVVSVKSNDFHLIDRERVLTVATTDPKTRTVYISKDLHGDFLRKVFIHELGHVAMISYGLLTEIHRMARPEYWIEIEEYICNFIANYGEEILTIASEYLGYDAIHMVPQFIDNFVS